MNSRWFKIFSYIFLFSILAYYYAKQQQSDAPTVNVIDTSNGDIVALYQQAVANGADFVVGPLTKSDLQTLTAKGELSVPTLALNTLDNGAGAVHNLYQFGLSPQDEAEQAAVRAKQAGHSRALVIAPAGAWGQGIAQAFEKRWQSLGGTIVDTYAFIPKGDLNNGVRKLLAASAASKNAPNRSRFVPTSRSDFDVIFMAAFPSDARQIKPLLVYYNVGNTPVYATSLIYSGTPSPVADSDLNGVEFSDMPWILGPDMPQWSAMRDRMKTLWGASYDASPRLYAFGVDAYHLTYTLNKIAGSSGTIPGATGTLSIDANQQVKRQLKWAKMENGVPIDQ